MKHYSQVFGPVEVQMMLSAFSNIETVHIAAYSHLLDTIGMTAATAMLSAIRSTKNGTGIRSTPTSTRTATSAT